MEDVDSDRLAELAWLQRLARALLQRDDADDLAQDTWLVAQARAPRDGRPLRPWLSRVALNLVRMQVRSRQRREAREQAADAFAELVPTPEALIERVELQRHVAGEVLALGEPYRSTVLLHYFEELSCADIARRLGIPEATIRGRLKVALARLRERFATRKSVAPLLAPLAGIQPAAHESAAVVGGVIAMKKLVISIALVLVLVVAAVLWKQRSGESAESGVGVMQPHSPLAPAGVRVAGASSIPLWMTQAELPARRIAGRVEYAGAPVAGAIVRLALEPSPGVLLPVAESRSDAAGGFDFGTQPAATFTVSAEASRHTAASITLSIADPSARPDQLVLLLGACNLRLDGKVLDAAGGPIVNARLTSSGLGGSESDARGEYVLCLGATRAQVRVQADGYGALEVQLMLNGPLRQDFRLVPEGVLVGVVMTETNQPVPGARVMASPDPIERAQHLAASWAIADAAGTFRISGLAPGRYRLTATAEGLASSVPIDAVVRAGSTAFSMIIRVTGTTHVRGRVMMAGKPVVGARVFATRNGEPVGASGYSQADGSFALAGVPHGPIGFVVKPYEVTSPSSIVVDAGIDDVVVNVAKLASIRGRVTRHGGPVPGAEVFVPRVIAVQADAAGNYVLDGLAAGQVKFYAGHSGLKAFANKTVSLRAGEDQTVDLELDLAGEARGIVLDEHGAAVPGVYVRMASEDGNDFGESTTDADGRFDCFNLAGGEYGIRVFPSPVAARPFLPATGERFPAIHVPQDGASTEVTLAIINDRLEIRGVVVDENGVFVPDVYVEAIVRGRGQFTLPSVMTDANGRFVIENLAPGDYAIHAHAADGSEGIATGVAGGSSNVEIELVAPGSVEGTLTGFSAPPSVELALLSTNVRIVTTALVDGTRFWQRGLRPGRYAVQARAGGEVDSVEVEVQPGQATRVGLQNRRTGHIEGVVTEFGTTQPIAGMRCEAKLSLAGPPTDPAMQAVSDATGHFTMRAPVGTVHLLCSPPDQSLSITGDDVEVVADATANVAVIAVRGKFGTVRGDAGFSLTPMTLPLQLARVNPTATQGARDGDRLVAIDGTSVRGMLPLTAMFLVWNHRPGTTITIDVLRAGTPMTFKIPVSASK